MSKRNYESHGSTISGAIILGLLAMCGYGLAHAQDYPPPQPCAHFCSHHGARADNAALDRTAQLTQFTISQNLNVETVVCLSYFSHADLQQYGAIDGKSCTSTGALLAQTTSASGHIHVSFSFSDGTAAFDVVGCRVDSTVLTPGFDSVAVTCL